MSFFPAPRRTAVFRGVHLTALLLAAAAGGCVVHESRRAPEPGVTIPAYSVGSGAPAAAPATAAWWRTLESPLLDRQMELALRNSHSVEAARARLAQADAYYRRASAVRWPEIGAKAHRQHDLAADVRREDYSEFGPVLAWEVDLFGRLENARRTRAMERASRLGQLDGARLVLSANVAEAYLGVIEQKELLRLLQSQIAASQEMLSIIEGRFRQGLISRVDLLQQQGQLADILSQVPDAESNLQVQQKILDTLVHGRSGDVPAVRVDESLPAAGPLPAIGDPNALLLARPDLRSARADVSAADADIGRAIAERLPRLTFAADALEVAGRGRSGLLSTLDGSVLLPLLDWGNRRAEVRRARAVHEERLAVFAQAYVDAVLEVENGVTREVKQRELIARLEERRQLLQAALDQSKERYTAGMTDYLPVLTSLQQLNALEQRLIRERRKLLSFRVTLHRALGGPMPDFPDPVASASRVRPDSRATP